MKYITLIFFMLCAFGSSAQSHCDDCSEIPEIDGEIELCFTDPAFSGKCATFVADKNVFWYENKSAKSKYQIRTFALPGASHSIANYLMDLQSDKKKKLTGGDLLFLERAILEKKKLEDIADWNEKAKSEGYTITESGLAYKVIHKANGTRPEPGDKVTVHYTGYLYNGKVFDSSRERNQPFVFDIAKGMVIKGWDEGLALMNVGSRYLFRIPPDLAYGKRAVGNVIPPNATLFFDVELIGVE